MNQTLITSLATPDSLERIMVVRQIVLDRVRQAKNAEEQAQLALAQLGLTSRFELQYQGRRIHTAQSDDDLARALNLDRDIWLVLHRRVMGQVQTSKQREAAEQAIYDGNYPPVRPEKILETLWGYQEGAQDAFIQSVYDFWRGLHARYVSNDAPCFGPKQVLTYACECSYKKGHVRLTRYAAGQLEDLTRIMGMYRTQGMAFEVCNAPTSWNWSDHETGQWLDFGVFSVKVFKNGNLHLRLQEEVREALNQTLATAAGKRLHSDRVSA